MPILLHITDERFEARIRRSGITPSKGSGVVYCMPVTQSHLVSHQWVRELKLGGTKNFLGVYFRLPSDEPVWSGKFHEEHRQHGLGDAIARLRSLDDPLGFEVLVPRKILPSELHRLRPIHQRTGWRYYPGAHGKRPCGCPACQRSGGPGSAKLRREYEADGERPPALHEARAAFEAARTGEQMQAALVQLDQGKRWKADPGFLERASERRERSILVALAEALANFRHPAANRMLLQLCAKDHQEVRRSAAESLCSIHEHQSRELLGERANDAAVASVLEERGL